MPEGEGKEMVLWKAVWRAAAWKPDCLTETIDIKALATTKTEYEQGVKEIILLPPFPSTL